MSYNMHPIIQFFFVFIQSVIIFRFLEMYEPDNYVKYVWLGLAVFFGIQLYKNISFYIRYKRLVKVIDMQDPKSVAESDLPEELKEKMLSFIESLEEVSNKKCNNPKCKNCWSKLQDDAREGLQDM